MLRRVMLLSVFSAFALAQSASAALIPIVGSESLGGIQPTATSSNPSGGFGNIKTSTVFTVQSFSVQNFAGDFTFDSTTTFGTPVTFNISGGVGAIGPIVINGVGWGSLSLDHFTLDDNTPLNARNLYFTGTFSPGPNFSSYGSAHPGDSLTTNTASFQIGLTQQGGAGTSVSFSGSLNTPALPTPGRSTPEPTTILAALFGVVPFVVARRRRRLA